ncbi:MAG: hypothetical protein Q7U75_00350, partial [Desulfobacterales bacterium]|nr:hypothetical protein [Desulfobacterales bacterium]
MAVIARILRLHLIDFLSAICGIAVFLASTKSIAADFRTGKLIQTFLMMIAPAGRSPQMKKLGQRGQVRAS